MFQDNDRAAKTGGIETSPQRVKRFKTRAIGLALLSLTICQAAIAQEACPTGPTKTSGADGAWDIIKIRDFGLWMGSPERQLMLCLHRGFHSNIDDDTSEFGSITRGVAEHTWLSIRNAFQVAPCVELDFQARTLNAAAIDAGSSKVILSHEAVGNRVMSQYTMILGRDVVDAGLVPQNCYPYQATPRDRDGNATFPCDGTNQYNPATDTYQQPSDLHKFYDGAVASGSTNIKSITTGTIKQSWSGDNNGTPNGIVNLKGLMEWVNRCRDGGNVGMIVADIKTFDSLRHFGTEMREFMRALPNDAERQEFARYWMIKTKPWKMRKSGDPTGSFPDLIYWVTEMKKLDIPVIDTMAQAGNENASGATVKVGVDYDLARNYYIWNGGENIGLAGRRAIEIVVPGTARYDPIRAGKLNMVAGSNCRNTTSGTRNLASMAEAGRSCNGLPRSGVNKAYHPQIWGWVPLEDGRAANLKYSNGTSATPALPAGQTYLIKNGKYPFGVASSNLAPFPFVIGKDTEERQPGYVPDTLGARAITIDSISVFRNLYTNYTTSQQYFLKP